MINVFKNNYKKNNFLSEKQFNEHINIFYKYRQKLEDFLFKKKILFKNKFELIDILSDLPEPEKNIFSEILGGFLNHEYYFKNITFNKNFCFGEIQKKILFSFNNFDNFKKNMIKIFNEHNGWGWLVINNNKLSFLKTNDNNNPMFPISLGGFNSVPIICIDLHEHSYFYDYFSNKTNYINLFLDHINWYEIENRFQNYILNFN